MNTKIEQTNNKLSVKPLSSVLTKASLTAIIISMSAYTLFEMITSDHLNLKDLLIHHLFPTIFIGVIIWGVLSFILKEKVVTPVKDIIEHLRHIGVGRFAPLQLDSKILEIGTIVTGVNYLSRQLREAPDSDGTEKAIDDLITLRANLKLVLDRDQINHEQLIPIMKDLKSLEGNLLSSLQVTSGNLK
jgi:signal transduction histidine kinase